MYFNDDSQRGQYKFPISMFQANFAGVVGAIGSTFTYFKDQTAAGSHYSWLQTNDAGETAATYLEYFNQFDTILYTGTDYVSGSDPWLSENFIQGLLDYVDGGGGIVFITDHDSFQKVMNPIVANFGIQFTSSADRNPGRDEYKVSTILGNSSYLPGGFHPLFENISPTASISAGASEGNIVYYDKETGLTSTDNPNPTARTSQYSSGDSKSVTITAHTDSDSTPISGSKLIIRTASGCGDILDAIEDSQSVPPTPETPETLYLLVKFLEVAYPGQFNYNGQWLPTNMDERVIDIGLVNNESAHYYAFPKDQNYLTWDQPTSWKTYTSTTLPTYYHKQSANQHYEYANPDASWFSYLNNTSNAMIVQSLTSSTMRILNPQYVPDGLNTITESRAMEIKQEVEDTGDVSFPTGTAFLLRTNWYQVDEYGSSI